MLKLNKKTPKPKFLTCDSSLEPDQCFILHTQSPRLLVEVIQDYGESELEVLRENGFLFKTVKTVEDTNDLLIVVESYDDDKFKKTPDDVSFNVIMGILDEMAEYYNNELIYLQNFEAK